MWTCSLYVDNTGGYYKLASLHYQLGEADESLIQIRECLKLDPEHKATVCFEKIQNNVCMGIFS